MIRVLTAFIFAFVSLCGLSMSDIEGAKLSHVIEYEIGAPYEYKLVVKAESNTITTTRTDLYTGEAETNNLQLRDWQIKNLNQLCEVALGFKGTYEADSQISDVEYLTLSIDDSTKMILVDRFTPAPVALKQLCDYMNLFTTLSHENDN